MPNLIRLAVERGTGDRSPLRIETLDNVVLRLQYYVLSDDYWYFDCSTDSNDVLWRGRRMTGGVDFLWRYRFRSDVPKGRLFVSSGRLYESDPTKHDFDNGIAVLRYAPLEAIS